MNVPELLQTMLKKNISDIHFKVGSPPSIRINGKLVSTGFENFTAKHIEEIVYGLLNKEQKEIFDAEDEIDMSYGLEGVSRFRVNIYRQRGTVALTLRVIPFKVKTFEELNLPANILKKLAEEPRGLILFAGITGAGKTTTMNAVVDYINENFAYKIVSIEDPIEYFHKDKKSFISQREIGADTKSFGRGLKYVLRQDPDVVCIGEMRDFEAISAGLTAAETGHLVLSTIHTMNAIQTIDRIVDAYPPHQQHQVRIALSNVVKGIIAQRLISTISGDIRLPATEILIGTSLVRKNIAEGKSHEIYKLIEQGEYYGMQTFDQDIIKLYKDKKITLEDALENATNPDDLMLKIKGIDREEK
ncbi:MAG: type IV pili twitching motility protein PilT [Elusimicrobia bacterium HGW-Elusimicrobia-4]|nr:MAG: type IV pili twitching motility protein PilT [Elusimicrobia bacterium HGW-Elusimicrobia-4]